MSKILTNDSPQEDLLLHKPAKRVKDPHATEIVFLMQEMAKIAKAPGVAGIAATQLGKSWRIFALNIEKEEPVEFFINPKIVAMSDTTQSESEGCLSVPNKHGIVERSISIVLKYQDRNLNSKILNVFGAENSKIINSKMAFKARAIQHEMDHLDGVLYVDRTELTYSNSQAEEAFFKKKNEEANV